jgi:hypothetical protein
MGPPSTQPHAENHFQDADPTASESASYSQGWQSWSQEGSQGWQVSGPLLKTRGQETVVRMEASESSDAWIEGPAVDRSQRQATQSQITLG